MALTLFKISPISLRVSSRDPRDISNPTQNIFRVGLIKLNELSSMKTSLSPNYVIFLKARLHLSLSPCLLCRDLFTVKNDARNK